MKIPKGAIIIYRRKTGNTRAKRKKKMTLHKTKKLHIAVQKVCKAIYEQHKDKQNKQRISH
jgi:hypothetical protein